MALRTFTGLFSLCAVLGLYFAVRNAGDSLSPQGCRMSWMSPSYVLQTGMNDTWSPLASRYSLWLYREVGWDSAVIGNSLPVLFIPGNAGSSHQVRSIASSAARQYYGSPRHISQEFASRVDVHRPLDVYAVEFNEDLTAFHGTTLQSQIQYTTRAISYILSHYPPGTRILVLGHSMGGIVATSLLPSSQISAIIAMATPFALPPARFDPSIDSVYTNLHKILADDPTPILSICGGATDKMIPSESCILPHTNGSGFRRTVFTSALEGSWTGVGHEAIVWCHQARWRVARAALELSPYRSTGEVVKALDRWLRDGHTLPPDGGPDQELTLEEVENAQETRKGTKLQLTSPTSSTAGTYRLEVPRSTSSDIKSSLIVLLSQGSVNGLGPQRPIPLRASIYGCVKDNDSCTPLPPTVLKLLPSPIPGKPFPVPKEGSDESTGVVVFEADLSSAELEYVIIKVENADGRGWLLASIEEASIVSTDGGMISLLVDGLTTPVPKSTSLRLEFRYPALVSNALVAYRVTAVGKQEPRCSNILFPPLLVHGSNPDETHYFPLRNRGQPRTILHTHSPAPFIPTPGLPDRGIGFSIYSSGLLGCDHATEGIHIAVDLPMTMASLGNIAGVSVALERYTRLLPRLLLITFAMSFIPFAKTRYLGNGGDPWFSVIAPLILMISSGLVVVSWLLLSLIKFGLRKIMSFASTRGRKKTDASSVSKNTLVSIGLLFLAIFLFIPWQVAFLGCWVFHLSTCAASHAWPEAESLPRGPDGNHHGSDDRREKTEEMKNGRQNNANLNDHFLLLMTWLLPLVAPILAVWVRTLATAGLTTPFNGDHNFLNVAPFLILVDFASWTPTRMFEPAPFERWVSARWLFALIATAAFFFGSRNPYFVFWAVALVITLIAHFGITRYAIIGLHGAEPLWQNHPVFSALVADN
ncbi:GPI inositol-deacylase [Coprinopsis cinerea okayama7|uniref:GPI inositol-deacylase n=1 Tax=Coprinopsis cinerea (strain Okayama-7 / 130 / ATCC MYA-4618 / FGSC 9003) TaxID=240176 RepID=D6RMK1_COPC7|nr:GPI inositol-deacylase [Coprinopsis cinerea okayama7\|eukprot:XP_002911258.1 GPI inositol-deacylase [Coprinopsis cinerea okayama7\